MSIEDNKEEPKKKKSSAMDEFPIQEYKLVPTNHVERSDEQSEIDLLKLVKTIWENRKTIYKFVTVGFILGILVVLLSPKEYLSTTTLMPEYSTESQSGASSLLQQYGGLLGLSGGSYNSASNAIRVDLYPKIVESLSFQDKLARQKFYFPDYDTVTSIYHYNMVIKSSDFMSVIKKFTIGLPGMIVNSFKEDKDIGKKSWSNESDVIRLSKEEMIIIEDLRKRVVANLDEETGVVSISARMQDPELAASIAKFTVEELTYYLTEYRTEKVLRDLDFIEEQLGKSEERFNEAQLTLAEFQDSNQGNLTARARTDEQRLNSEYDVAFNLYNSLTQQYEEAKLKVQEETPMFKVLQPVQIPVNDQTSGFMILILFMMLSGILGSGWIFIRHFLKSQSLENY
ncbi:MAG: Wzz/FepE/Etk N-terminal domain-containing protein [Balneola sp.]